MSLVNENLGPTGEEIAKLDDYKQQLERHDWFFYFSDDHRVYTGGENESNRILNLAKNGPIEFKKAYNDAHKRRFDTPTFTGEDNKHPWKPPFPEAEAEDRPTPKENEL